MHTKQTILCLLISCFFICLTSCNKAPTKIENTVTAYYEVYKTKEDFEGFLKFYDDDIVLIDIINGDSIVGIEQLTNFFAWNTPGLERTNPVLMIEDQIIEGNKVVTRGYFTPFKWQGQPFEAMYFVTILYFNETGKIRKQIDWINYPNTLVDYANRKNANQWIKGLKIKIQ